MTAANAETPPLRERSITFASGAKGVNIAIPSASPINYHQLITAPDEMPRTVIDGKLFRPVDARPPYAAVLVVPGSLGVAPSHVRHAETLCDLGFATCIVDSFAARGVISTVANQAQFSFAASACDVLAAYRVLAGMDDIDAQRIGAQGHSRGGTAVMMAASRCLADAMLGRHHGLAAILAAYPWCGQQFENPAVGDTEVLVLMGDADEWCAPVQVQAQCHAIRLTGGKATMHLDAGAHHSYDRDTPLELVAEARVAPGAPITYLADNGAMILAHSDAANPDLVDRDGFVHALKSGHGRRGAHIGSAPGEAQMFREDMIAFWKRALALH
ncbi:MAG: dienelactone hydrolase family protein [Gammaproteobacteria bacterium]|nr:dienelactone hydrolase family protein [Gammaproteobacteria bacterium]